MAKRPPNAPAIDPGTEMTDAEIIAAHDGEPAPAASAGLSGPTQGELDEAQQRVLDLEEENMRLRAAQELMDQRMARLEAAMMRGSQPAPRVVDEPFEHEVDPEGKPVFNEQDEFGVITGDHQAAYFQRGHYFGRDRRYMGSESKANMGRPRAFNPKMVGQVRPRPGASANEVDRFWAAGNDREQL